MKKLIIYFSILICVVAFSTSNKELYKITDSFVDSLHTTYESYGTMSISNSITTSDGRYMVTPIGRLIVVKILEVVSNDVYEELKDNLTRHYRNDYRVNGVYINGAGTIAIDCRN